MKQQKDNIIQEFVEILLIFFEVMVEDITNMYNSFRLKILRLRLKNVRGRSDYSRLKRIYLQDKIDIIEQEK